MSLLDENAIVGQLAGIPGWERSGDTITKTVTLDGFIGAISYVNSVAELAEEADHHPDITIRWDTVTLVLSTHSAGGLTEKDFSLARQLNTL